MASRSNPPANQRYLTQELRYEEWLKEVMVRARHEGGRNELTKGAMLPISAEISERVREDWSDGGLTPSGGHLDDPVEERGAGCVICNAEVRPPGPKRYWQHTPTSTLQVAAVDAVFPAHSANAAG